MLLVHGYLESKEAAARGNFIAVGDESPYTPGLLAVIAQGEKDLTGCKIQRKYETPPHIDEPQFIDHLVNKVRVDCDGTKFVIGGRLAGRGFIGNWAEYFDEHVPRLTGIKDTDTHFSLAVRRLLGEQIAKPDGNDGSRTISAASYALSGNDTVIIQRTVIETPDKYAFRDKVIGLKNGNPEERDIRRINPTASGRAIWFGEKGPRRSLTIEIDELAPPDHMLDELTYFDPQQNKNCTVPVYLKESEFHHDPQVSQVILRHSRAAHPSEFPLDMLPSKGYELLAAYRNSFKERTSA